MIPVSVLTKSSVTQSLWLPVLSTFTDLCIQLKSEVQNSFIELEKRVALGVRQSRRGVTNLRRGFVEQGGGLVVSPAS